MTEAKGVGLGWDESQHPRTKGGKFTNKGGSDTRVGPQKLHGNADSRTGGGGGASPDTEDFRDDTHFNDKLGANGRELEGKETRIALKMEIQARLAAATGIDPEHVSVFIHQWAISSNDSSLASLSIQKAISDEFKIKMSPWQETRYKYLMKQRSREIEHQRMILSATVARVGVALQSPPEIHASTSALTLQVRAQNRVTDISNMLTQLGANTNRGEAPALAKLRHDLVQLSVGNAPAGSTFPLWTAVHSKEANALLSARGREMATLAVNNTYTNFKLLPTTYAQNRQLVRAMYNDTQARLKEAGIEHVQLARGMGWSRDGRIPETRVVSSHSNVAESWATRTDVARGFAQGEHASGKNAVVVSAWFHRSQILSYWGTGFGCAREYEFVTLGARNRARRRYRVRERFYGEDDYGDN